MSRVPAIDRAAFVARSDVTPTPGRRPRARQPDRRAHRLQRRLRAADVDSAGHRAPPSRAATIGGSGARTCSDADRASSLRAGRETPGRGWLDYVQGLTQALARARVRARRASISRSTPTVPVGSGLSSSAALEVSVLRGSLRAVPARPRRRDHREDSASAAENDFVGAPVGIMDQMASSLAQPGVALFIDTRSLDYEQVRLPAATELVVINSGVAHNHAAGRLPDAAGGMRPRRRAARRRRAPRRRPRSPGRRGRAAGAHEPPRAAHRDREFARAGRGGRDARAATRRRWAGCSARPMPPSATTSSAPCLRSIASCDCRDRAGRLRRAAHRRRLRRVHRRAGACGRGGRRRQSRRRCVRAWSHGPGAMRVRHRRP